MVTATNQSLTQSNSSEFLPKPDQDSDQTDQLTSKEQNHNTSQQYDQSQVFLDDKFKIVSCNTLVLQNFMGKKHGQIIKSKRGPNRNLINPINENTFETIAQL